MTRAYQATACPKRSAAARCALQTQALLTVASVPWDAKMSVRDLQRREAVADARHEPERMARADFAKLTIAKLRELLAMHGLHERPKRADGKSGPPKHADYVSEAFQKLNPVAHAAEEAVRHAIPFHILQRIGSAIGMRADRLRFALAIGDRETIANIRAETAPAFLVCVRENSSSNWFARYTQVPLASSEELRAAIADPSIISWTLRNRDGSIFVAWAGNRSELPTYGSPDRDAHGTVTVSSRTPLRPPGNDPHSAKSFLMVESLRMRVGLRPETLIQWGNLTCLPKDARAFNDLCKDLWIGLDWVYRFVPGILKPRSRDERIAWKVLGRGFGDFDSVPTERQLTAAVGQMNTWGLKYRRRWER